MFQNIKNIGRLKELSVIFLEEGFGYFIERLGLLKLIPLTKRFKTKFKKDHSDVAVGLRKAFERAGPVFVKFGQFLSLRPDLVPENFIKELEKLQDKAPTFSFSKVKEIISKELKVPLKNLSEKPVASASISQVHKAKYNNKFVAVKIRRPNVDKIFEKDTALLLFIAKLLENKFLVFKRYRAVDFVEEFKRWSADELDFRVEASNAKILKNNFKDSKDIIIPSVYLSSEKVMVSDFIEGIPLHDIEKIKKQGKNYKKYIDITYDAVVRMVFEHGFFHADPHPANIIVNKKGIGFVDFGIMGFFDDNLKFKSLEIFDAFVEGDIERIVKGMMSVGSIDSKNFDEDSFKRDLRVVVNQLRFSSLEDIEVSRILSQAFGIALKHNIRFPIDFVLFSKTIITLEGVGLRYNPSFRLVDSSRPLIKKIARKNLPKKILSKVKTTTTDYETMLTNLPSDVMEILNNFKKGGVKVDIEDTDVKNLTLEMERSSGNLSVGMIIAALIVGSSVISQIETQPALFGFPAISFLGISFAVVLSFWLLHRTLFSSFNSRS